MGLIESDDKALIQPENIKKSILTASILILLTITISLIGLVKPEIILDIEHLFYSILALVVEIMNILGGFLILFGSVLLVSRYVRSKIKAPDVPFCGVSPRFTFLTFGLEIFIGAEIINTAITRTLDDFLLLSLTIVTRGLIGFLLYMERKWGSNECDANTKEKCSPENA